MRGHLHELGEQPCCLLEGLEAGTQAVGEDRHVVRQPGSGLPRRAVLLGRAGLLEQRRADGLEALSEASPLQPPQGAKQPAAAQRVRPAVLARGFGGVRGGEPVLAWPGQGLGQTPGRWLGFRQRGLELLAPLARQEPRGVCRDLPAGAERLADHLGPTAVLLGGPGRRAAISCGAGAPRSATAGQRHHARPPSPAAQGRAGRSASVGLPAERSAGHGFAEGLASCRRPR
jgi:hypothetical protein